MVAVERALRPYWTWQTLLIRRGSVWSMEFTRIGGQVKDGMDTHETSYFKKIWKELQEEYGETEQFDFIIDPFARNCALAHSTNDIDPETTARYHMDALEFLDASLHTGDRAGLVIFDPPFSRRQAERYEVGHVNVYTDPGYVPSLMRRIESLLVPGGLMLKFGYNSTRHRPLFRLLKGWIVNFGGARNDVIVTLWEKEHTLEDFVDV